MPSDYSGLYKLRLAEKEDKRKFLNRLINSGSFTPEESNQMLRELDVTGKFTIPTERKSGEFETKFKYDPSLDVSPERKYFGQAQYQPFPPPGEEKTGYFDTVVRPTESAFVPYQEEIKEPISIKPNLYTQNEDGTFSPVQVPIGTTKKEILPKFRQPEFTTDIRTKEREREAGKLQAQREFTENLSKEQIGIARKIANYELPLPSSFSMSKPYWQGIIGQAIKINPNFDIKDYQFRISVKRDFTSGKNSINIKSLNQSIAHLGELKKAGDKLINSPIELWNRIANTGLSAIGDPRVKNFTTAQNAVDGELSTVFKGTSGTDQEIKSWKEQTSSSNSPEQIQGAIRTAVDLVASRVAIIKDQYESNMKQPLDMAIIYPKSLKILKEMGIDTGQFDIVAEKSDSPSAEWDAEKKKRYEEWKRSKGLQ